MTNLEKYNEARDVLDKRAERYVEKFFTDHPRPDFLYRAQGIESKRWTVTHIKLSHEFYQNKKPSRQDVKAIRLAVGLPLNIDPAKLFVYVELKEQRTSAAVSWQDLHNGVRDFYLSAERAEEAARRFQEIYGAREGHKPCGYCGKQTLESALTARTVHLHGGKRADRRYCSGQCAAYDQFAQEG